MIKRHSTGSEMCSGNIAMEIFTAKMFFSHFALVVDFPLLIKESVQLLHGSFALLNGMENQPEFYVCRYEILFFFF